MGFLTTLKADDVDTIWKNFDIFLIKKFKSENETLLSDDEINETIKDGNLTIKYQEDLNLEALSLEERKSKVSESEEYLVLNFATQEVIDAYNAWKELN
jgi:hypothetical protein